MQKLKTSDLNRLTKQEFKSAQKNPVIIILDNLRSAHNVGSIFRTADAFLVEEIFLCGITSTPPSREIEKTALGATSTVKWRYFDQTAAAIKAAHDLRYNVWSVEQTSNSRNLGEFTPPVPIAFIFGNEVSGVSDDALKASDGAIEIPQFGSKHSFNVSVCCGIILWEVLKQLP